MKYAYSTDEENYVGEFDTLEQAAQEAFDNDDELESVSVAEIVKKTAHAFVNPHLVIEQVQEAAADESGEWSADWLDSLQKDDDKMGELKALVGEWIQAQEPPRFWTVENAKEVSKP